MVALSSAKQSLWRRLLLASVLFPAIQLSDLPAAYAQTPLRAYADQPKHLAPADLLRSGPMVGYSAMRAVGLWVQLTRPGGAMIEYWEVGKPERRWRTAIGTTTETEDNVVQLLADSVQPGRKYTYRLWAADEEHPRLHVLTRPYPLEFQSQPLWQWRTDPPAFRVALGSGAYINDAAYDRPGEPFGGQYSIFQAIDQNRPDLMVWLGDNTYLREADWDSPLGLHRRYAHTRALPELQPLLGSVHHYAMWDDHDYGPNDSDRSWALKEEALSTFKRFWRNPVSGLGGGGITSTFQWADVQFFLLDNRWNRTPDADDAAHGHYLGVEQLRWLTESLAASKATFKVVAMGGQVLNPAKLFENYANYAQERTELLRRLAELKVPGVIFVSGDRHHAELSRLERPGLYPLYDLTTSPLTGAPVANGRTEANPLREDGTFVAERNFALFDIAGPLNNRTLTLTLCDAMGKPIWKRHLRASELQVPNTTPPPPVVNALPPIPEPALPLKLENEAPAEPIAAPAPATNRRAPAKARSNRSFRRRSGSNAQLAPAPSTRLATRF